MEEMNKKNSSSESNENHALFIFQRKHQQCVFTISTIETTVFVQSQGYLVKFL